MNSSDKPREWISSPSGLDINGRLIRVVTEKRDGDALTGDNALILVELDAHEKLQSQLNIALEALKSAKVHSECYEELILIIDQALEQIGGGDD